MSKFEDLVPPGADALWRELRKLREEIAELRAARSNEATSVSAGMFTVDKDGGFRVFDQETGVSTFYAGAGTDSETGEPTGMTTVYWNRNDGSRFLDVGHFLETGEQVGVWRDRAHNEMISDDRGGIGLSRPWIPIPGSYQYVTVSGAGTVYSYPSLPVTAITSEQMLWEARIPLVSHPYIDVYGTWGSATGSSNTTYRLEVGGNTVGTWSTTGTELRTGRGSGGIGTSGGFNMTDSFNTTAPAVRLFAQSSGTGNVACEVASCYMRGSPPP